MKLPPFLLDRWFEQKHHADPPIEYDLASSTGPVWTLRELLDLTGDNEIEPLLSTNLVYTSAAGAPDLREAIAAHQGVDADDVQVVTGAAEALLTLFVMAAEPGANVVLPHPGFPTNRALADCFGLEVRDYSLRPENGFKVDLDEIRAAVDANTRFVLVNSPHNPTGTVLTEPEMQALHDFCAERGVQFIADEVYHPIYHGQPMRSASRLPHATVLCDFSKALCLSGLRMGWIIERDAERRAQYMDAHSYFTVSNTALSERLAVIALRHREKIYDRARRVAQGNLLLLAGLLDQHPAKLRWIKPGGGMTAFPWLVNGGDGREFSRALLKRGVLIAPGDCFGMPAHIRIGFAASGDQFSRGLERFAELLSSDAWLQSSAAALNR